MRFAWFAVCACGASCAAVGPAQQGPAVRADRISIYLGQRNLDEDDWGPVEEQAALGVEFVHEPQGSAVGFEVGIMGSGDDTRILGTDVEGSTGELYGGIKKTFGGDSVQPYVGGGLSLINARFESGGSDDDDSSVAGYLHGGLGVHVTDTLLFGLDLRFLFGSDVTLFGVDGDADYAQVAVFAGFEF